MADLFADSDSSEEIGLKTENEYAKRYDTWREKEELHKLEQKYGENPTEADLDESDSEDTDDEPPEVPERLEKDFLKTLSLLKKKDPRIYNPEFKFFVEGEEKNEAVKTEKEVVEKPKKAVVSLAQAFGASDDESDGEIFTVEKPTEVSPPAEEVKLKEFLTGKAVRLGDETEADLLTLKALWSDPKLNEGEAFLRDYILNKKYLAEDGEDASGKLLDDAELDADAAIVEEQGRFERAYNFRFEEPDHEYLKRYPRTMSTVRPKDERRARKRAEVRERKEREKQSKMEEIARMKALKLKEIREKIAKIKEVTGNQELAFRDEDIEGEFDPTEHDRRMRAIFDEQYYGEHDTEKPVFPDLDEELEIENWDKYEEEMGLDSGKSSKDAGPHCEDEDFNMDADYDPKKARTTLMEEIQETLGKKRRSRKRKTRLAAVLAKEKPKFDPATAEKTYAEYMDEYYRMNCEDVIGGDLPTRFKYREVVPNSYGLTVEEILLADDKELNKWVPLKKAVKYRPEHIEKSEVKTYQQKANDLDLKRKLIPSLFKEVEEHAIETSQEKKKKKKKKTKRDPIVDDLTNPSKSAATANVSVEITDNEIEESKAMKKSKKKKNRMVENLSPFENKNDQPLQDDVNNTSKKKNKHKTKQSEQNVPADNPELARNVSINETNVENTKTKQKHVQTNGKIQNQASQVVADSTNSERIGDAVTKKKRRKKNKPELNPVNDDKSVSKEKNIKRKQPIESYNVQAKKIKFNPKSKHTSGKDAGSGNPMDKLSDERLKAYGLNPKKYRSFLKYKKF